MAEQQTFSAIGLNTNPNELASPAGSLVSAQNCVMLAPGLVGSRRGQADLSYVPSAAPAAVGVFGDTLIWQTGTNTLERDTGTAFVAYDGTYTPPDATIERMKFMEAAQNFYATTSTGIVRLDSATGTPTAAGGPLTRDFDQSTNTGLVLTGTSGFLAAEYGVAYRVVFASKDAHGTLHMGPPSGRATITNTNASNVAASGTLTISGGSGSVGGTIAGTTVTVTWATSDAVAAAALAAAINANATLSLTFVASAVSNVVTITCRSTGTTGNSTTLVATGTGVSASGATFSGGTGGATADVTVKFLVPSDVTTQMFWRLYRSRQVPSSVTPDDELALVHEAYFTSTDLTNGYVSYVDASPDSFLGPYLYTNENTGDGTLQANDAPPLALDMTWWDDRAWYANTARPQSVTIQILGCGVGANGSTGVRLGDTLQVGTYSAVASTSFDASGLSGQYKLFTDSDPGTNIERTARSLVTLINTGISKGLYRAQYISSPDDAPGKILISRTALGTSLFALRLLPGAFTIASGGLSRTGGVTTATTTLDHGLAVGDTVYVKPFLVADANFPAAAHTVASVPSSTTFTYSDATPGDHVSTSTYFELRLTPSPALAWNPPPPSVYFNVAAGGLVRTGGSTVTVTMDSSHTLVPGMIIPIEPAETADPNFPAGTKTVVTVPSTTTFTYTEAGTNAASTTAYQSGARVLSSAYQDVAGLNYVSYSKTQQPEAVPQYANYFAVGTAGRKILRIFPHRNYLFVFKEEGIYVISGAYPNYSVQPLDLTNHLYAPDSVVSVDNRVFALTNKGVVIVSAAGCQPVSGPIDQELNQYFGPTLANVRVQAFGVSRETDQLYELHMPALSGATAAPYNARRVYCFSTEADAWTTWEVERTCGIVRVSDDAYYSGGTTALVYKERNTKTAADYVDGLAASFAATAFSALPSGNFFTVADSTGAVVGNSIGAGATTGIILAVVSSTVIQTSCSTYEGSFATYSEWEIKFDGCSGSGGATIDGHVVSLPTLASDLLTAQAFQTYVNADPTLSAIVRAEIASNYVQLFALTPGTPTFTVTALGTGRTLNQEIPGTNGDVVSYSAIPIELKWRTFVANSPADWKQFREVQLHHRWQQFLKGSLVLSSDDVSDEETVLVYPAEENDGTVPAFTVTTDTYPGMPTNPKKQRVQQLQSFSRSSYLNVAWNIREAYALWWLNGLTLIYEAGSELGTP